MKKISRLFIANRGEIVARIARTAKDLGITSVAASQEIKAYLRDHTDVIIPIAKESTEFFLNIEELIRLSKENQCQAVHPGFGFLSENAHFAQAVIDADLIWIGPQPSIIADMGDKSKARAIATKCEVPCIPGIEQPPHLSIDDWFSQVKSFSQEIGFPLLVKAAFGGGGKGMRIVNSQEELKPALASAFSEAQNAFANGQLIVEKYISHARHIEVQILGDTHGGLRIIGDRDCSLQRRHQKIIEEAPAPNLEPELRKNLHQAALRLGKKVGYTSAGTLEFILAEDQKTSEQSFYFLEMNTRLQVEHPVTEEIFGVDLVEWQLRVAQGEHLPLDWPPAPKGSAIEARIYAEDADNDFLPAPGRVKAFIPWHDKHLRWEQGIDGTDVVSDRFDPMIAKLIAWGPHRREALNRLITGLERSIIYGVKNNIEFLLTIAKTTSFRERPLFTNYLSTALPQLQRKIAVEREKLLSLQEHLYALPPQKDETHLSLTKRIYSQPEDIYPILKVQWISQNKGILGAKGETYEMSAGTLTDEEGSRTLTRLDLFGMEGKESLWQIDGYLFQSEQEVDQDLFAATHDNNTDEIRAPVPGKVMKILINAGDSVFPQQTLMTLESMKMEFDIKSPVAGTIECINVKPGDQIDSDTVLIDWQNGTE